MTTEGFAPAKINLTLHVTGQDARGYHLLDSLVVFADVGDHVQAEPAQDLSLRVTGPESADLTAEPDNLVLRAARLMGGGAGAALTLDKHLPVASGIGGGSADAAATLRVLARLWGRALPDPAQVLALGADVPVCLSGRPTRMQGVGEICTPVPPLPAMRILLVNPRVPVSTPQVFASLTQKHNPPMSQDLPAWPDLSAFANWLSAQRNDLLTPAIAQAPVIAEALTALRATSGCLFAGMSGSGATCFALFPPDPAGTADAMRALRQQFPAAWIAEGAVRR